MPEVRLRVERRPAVVKRPRLHVWGPGARDWKTHTRTSDGMGHHYFSLDRPSPPITATGIWDAPHHWHEIEWEAS